MQKLIASALLCAMLSVANVPHNQTKPLQASPSAEEMKSVFDSRRIVHVSHVPVLHELPSGEKLPETQVAVLPTWACTLLGYTATLVAYYFQLTGDC